MQAPCHIPKPVAVAVQSHAAQHALPLCTEPARSQTARSGGDSTGCVYRGHKSLDTGFISIAYHGLAALLLEILS